MDHATINGTATGVIAVVIGLAMFGYFYNQAVDRYKPHGYLEPYTSLWVAAGVLVTLAGLAILDLLVDWNAGIQAVVCFTASGFPMIVGDGKRYVKSIQRERERMRHDDHDPA